MGTALTFRWDEAAIERLRVLWFDGHSAREIGRAFGVSRNSIIGRVHRSGWSGADRVQRFEASKGYRLPPIAVLPPPEPEKPPAKKRRLPGPRLPKVAVRKPDPAIGSFTLMDLRHGVCKWPENDGDPWLFCGTKALEGEVYCEAHTRRSRQGPQHRSLRPIESYAIKRSRQAA